MNTIVNTIALSAARISPRTIKFFFALLSLAFVIMNAPEGDGGVAL